MSFNAPSDKTAPAKSVKAVTPHASNDLPDGVCRGLYVGGDGDVDLIAVGDDAMVTFAGVTAGSFLPVAAKAVRDSSTATEILALY
jgi:hypothetical protein